MIVDTILLGDGIFAINDVDVARTRGGGQFLVEREYREIEADGDYGPVKGRVVKQKSVGKLILNALTLLPTNMSKFYPATKVVTSGAGVDVWSPKEEIEDEDYQDKVSWTGYTKSGKQVYIKIQNAINLEGIDWGLLDKDEVVPQITYTATYLESARKTEPWDVEFTKGTTYSVTLTVESGAANIEDAVVRFNNETVLTNASGVATFTGVPVGANQEFKIIAGGYATYFGAVSVVSADVTSTISIEAL